MSLKLIGDLIICGMLLGSVVLFVVANVNYVPDEDKNDNEE